MNKTRSIAIDGPSGAGKSTVARALSEKLGYIYVDTGAMYRSIGLYAFLNDIDPKNERDICTALKKIKLDLKWIEKKQHIFLNGNDVSDDIRTPTISLYASDVSALPCVRDFLMNTQRELAEKYNVVMDGRDIGTVILPNADVKIFMTAKIEIRAERRYKELLEKGKKVTYDEVLEDMTLRDQNDSTRKTAPCKKAEDAYFLDNSDFDFDEVVQRCVKIVEIKINEAV